MKTVRLTDDQFNKLVQDEIEKINSRFISHFRTDLTKLKEQLQKSISTIDLMLAGPTTEVQVKKRKMPFDENKLKELINNGLSPKEIAKELDRTEGSVRAKMHDMGLKPKPKK